MASSKFQKHELVEQRYIDSKPAMNTILNEKVKNLIASGENIAHFAFGESPFPIPECLVKQLQKNAHHRSYLPLQGIPELRASLVNFHHKYDNLELEADNFLLAPGSKELLCILLKVFNGTVFLPSPSWISYEPQLELAGKRAFILETDKSRGWKVTPEILEKAITYLDSKSRKEMKMLILNNPGNPTGTCYTEEELKEISRSCRQHSIIVLSDEIYARLTFKEPHKSMLKFYPEGTILTASISKWASAGGWRLGYAYVPTTLRPLLEATCFCASHSFTCASAPIQYALTKTLQENSEELDSYIKDCSTVLKWVANYCYRELSSVGVTGHRSEASFYFMPDFEVIRTGLAKKRIFSSSQMTDAMFDEAKVALMGTEPYLRPSHELSVRFCFVCFDGTQALMALNNLKKESQQLKDDNDEFVKNNCYNLVEGIERLKKFVLKYKVKT